MSRFEVVLDDAAATAATGASLAQALRARAPAGAVIHLLGELGAGKTTLARGLLQALGVQGTVRSPTYTLMEPYMPAPGWQFLHMDLYRLQHPDELWELGLDSYPPESTVWLVEWPERGGAALPAADLSLTLERDGLRRRLIGQAQAPWAIAWGAGFNKLD